MRECQQVRESVMCSFHSDVGMQAKHPMSTWWRSKAVVQNSLLDFAKSTNTVSRLKIRESKLMSLSENKSSVLERTFEGLKSAIVHIKGVRVHLNLAWLACFCLCKLNFCIANKTLFSLSLWFTLRVMQVRLIGRCALNYSVLEKGRSTRHISLQTPWHRTIFQ